MEQHIQRQSQDELLPSLTYKPEATANYLEHVRLVRFNAAAGDRFSEAIRVIRFQLQDSCWLESSSIRFQCTLTNKATDAAHLLEPIAHHLSMFSNMKIDAASQLVEHIEELGVLANMIDRMKPSARRQIDSAMNHPLTDDADARKTLAGGQSRRLIMDLPAGLFKCGKLIPLHLLQMLSVELTLGDKSQAFTTVTVDQHDHADLLLEAFGMCYFITQMTSISHRNIG